MGPERTRAAAPPEPGYYLVIDELGKIAHSGEIPNAPRRFLQPPFITPRNLPSLRVTDSELVLHVLRADGPVLDAFGWPWTAAAFYDRPREVLTENASRIGRLAVLPVLRILRVPVPKDGSLLLLSRTGIDVDKDRKAPAVRRMALSLYAVGPPPRVSPQLPDGMGRLPIEPLPGEVSLLRQR